jgi:hypothetical protein
LGCYGCIFHGTGTRLSFVKTSEFLGVKPPNLPLYATVTWIGINDCVLESGGVNGLLLLFNPLVYLPVFSV